MINKPRFNEEKATALAVLFLQKANGKMSYMKLIKLMYLVDRTSLCKIGQFVTNDDFYSLKNGPILSNVMDLITEPNRTTTSWNKYISVPANFEIELKKKDLRSILEFLSDYEVEVANTIYSSYGKMQRWDLVDWTHKNLPEWKDPNGGRILITPEDILSVCGKSKQEVKDVLFRLAEQAQMERIFD